jgi:hypothetical protein
VDLVIPADNVRDQAGGVRGQISRTDRKVIQFGLQLANREAPLKGRLRERCVAVAAEINLVPPKYSCRPRALNGDVANCGVLRNHENLLGSL